MAPRFLALVAIVAQVASAITLTVSTSGGNASSPHLYGIMFEDINNSGDGALYGQMLRNNGFQGNSPGIAPFAPVGAATIAQDNSSTVGAAKHPTVRITANTTKATGQIGVSNAGYWGIRVYPQTYGSHFFIKGAYVGIATVSLVSASSGTVFGSGKISVKSKSNSFTFYQLQLPVTTTAPDGNNLWQITFDNTLVTGGSINVGFPVLFPPTYNARSNGINNEVGAAVAALKPSFLRFPGGNNLEGSSVGDRWIWNNTIGKPEDRPGRQGDWTYPNTDGLGLLEFMQFCEDVGMAPLLAVWDGLTLGGGVTTGSALTPYIEDVLNELEFLLGSSTSTWGSVRASLGYANPFSVPFVEIGNEDFLQEGASTYPARFQAFYNAIHSAYPSIKIIASTAPQTSSSGTITPPAGVLQDVHHYLEPDTFVAQFNEFDNWSRKEPLLVGEYASTTQNDGSQTYWEYMQGSVAEAVYMIGMERNSDVVMAASFAPLLEHFNVAEWSPDLFGYDATYGVTRSTSYFVQQMFSVNRGDTIRAVKSDTGFGPVYWVASSANGGKTYYVKLANYGASQENVTVEVAGKTSGTLTMLTGPQTQSNYPGQETVKPATSSVAGSGSFAITMPAWSVAVLAMK